jgi:hypothetical protein
MHRSSKFSIQQILLLMKPAPSEGRIGFRALERIEASKRRRSIAPALSTGEDKSVRENSPWRRIWLSFGAQGFARCYYKRSFILCGFASVRVHKSDIKSNRPRVPAGVFHPILEPLHKLPAE